MECVHVDSQISERKIHIYFWIFETWNLNLTVCLANNSYKNFVLVKKLRALITRYLQKPYYLLGNISKQILQLLQWSRCLGMCAEYFNFIQAEATALKCITQKHNFLPPPPPGWTPWKRWTTFQKVIHSSWGS